MNPATSQPSNSDIDSNLSNTITVKQEIDGDQCRSIAAQPTPVLEIEPDDEATDAQAYQNQVSQPTVCIQHEPNNGNLNYDCAECRGEVFIKGERIIDEEMIEVQEDDDDHNLEVKSEPEKLEPPRTPDHVPHFTSDDDDDEESTDEQPALPATPALKSRTCQDCSKSFSCLSGLRIHQRRHTGERPFKCSHCSKSFVQRQTIVRHLRTHTADRPYQCPDCNKSFALKTTLTNHRRTHTGERPYKCDQCSKTFTTNTNLIRHRRTHTETKPFKCTQCSKCYTEKSNLTRHLRVHATKNLL